MSKYPIKILEHKLRTHKVNGCIRLTLPSDFCKVIGIDGSEGENLVILVLERHKGNSVQEFNQVYVK